MKAISNSRNSAENAKEQPSDNQKVFISYSVEDAAFAQRLTASLNNHGILFWDYQKEVNAGDYIYEKIANAIKKASAFIVIVSAASSQSPAVTAEISLALAARFKHEGKRIIPILLDKTAQIPPFLKDYLYLDFTSLDYEISIEKLVTSLRLPNGINESSYKEVLELKQKILTAEYMELRQLQITQMKEYSAKGTKLTVRLSLIAAAASILFGLGLIGTSALNIKLTNFVGGVITGILGTIVFNLFNKLK